MRSSTSATSCLLRIVAAPAAVGLVGAVLAAGMPKRSFSRSRRRKVGAPGAWTTFSSGPGRTTTPAPSTSGTSRWPSAAAKVRPCWTVMRTVTASGSTTALVITAWGASGTTTTARTRGSTSGPPELSA